MSPENTNLQPGSDVEAKDVIVTPPTSATSEGFAVVPSDTSEATANETGKMNMAAQEGANVILASGRLALPEGRTNFGMKTVIVPNEEQQRAGFRLESDVLGTFVAQFGEFKVLVPKGTGAVQAAQGQTTAGNQNTGE